LNYNAWNGKCEKPTIASAVVQLRFTASLDSNVQTNNSNLSLYTHTHTYIYDTEFFNKVSCVDLCTTYVPPIEMYVFTK